MWWLFMDPEEAGPVAIVVLVLLMVGGLIAFIVHSCDPEVGRQQNNIIKPNTKTIEQPKTVVYDTILNNDSTLIIKLR